MKKALLSGAIMILTCCYSYAQSYLPLTGGTLTRPLIGTNASFQNYMLNNSAIELNTTLTTPLIYSSVGTGTAYPFLDYSNLIIQSRPSGADRDILFVTGSNPPTIRMVIGRTGNVGIGTINPVSMFNVTGSGSNSNGIAYIQSSDAGARGTLMHTGYYQYISQDNSGNYFQSWGMRLNGSDNLWYRTYTAANNYLPYTELSTGGTIVFGGAASNSTSDANPTLNQTMTINVGTGNVSIGTTDPKGYMLAVNGSAIATSMTVKLNANWPDYVFKKDYHLPSLTEVKAYIDQNQHLPDMPSAQEVEKNGQNLGEMNKLLTKKVEELTLYLVEKDKQITEMDQRQQAELKIQNEINKKLQEQLNELQKQLKTNKTKN